MHSTLLLGYKLKRDISVGGFFLAEIAGCVIISAAVLSSMIDHIPFLFNKQRNVPGT
jgi:hypothetical protein